MNKTLVVMFLTPPLPEHSDNVGRNNKIIPDTSWKKKIVLSTSLKNSKTQLTLITMIWPWLLSVLEMARSTLIQRYYSIKEFREKCFAFVTVLFKSFIHMTDEKPVESFFFISDKRLIIPAVRVQIPMKIF